MLIWSWRRARFEWVLGHVCIIPYSFCAGTKTKPFRIGHLFSHTNGDLGAISAMERRCAAPILKVESRISDRFSHYIRKLFLSVRKPIRCSTNRVFKRLDHQDFLTSSIWASQSSVCSNSKLPKVALVVSQPTKTSKEKIKFYLTLFEQDFDRKKTLVVLSIRRRKEIIIA